MFLSAALCLAWTGYSRRLKVTEQVLESSSPRQAYFWNKSLESVLDVSRPAAAFHPGHQGPLAVHRLNRIAHASSRVQRRSSVHAQVGAVLELERVPPVPPAPPTGGGGGGGDEDDSGDCAFLRLVTPQEKGPIIDDWVSRTRIYAMMDEFGGNASLAQAHRDALVTLTELRTFEAEVGMHMLFGYFDGDTGKVLALAGVNVNKREADELAVSCVAPHPAELNDEDSTVVRQTLHGLRLLADTLEMTLDETPLTNPKRSRQS